MLTLLADGNVLFVIRLGFWTGNVAHGIYLPSIRNFIKENKSITVTRMNYVYSIYRYLSTDYYYMLCVFHGLRGLGLRALRHDPTSRFQRLKG